MTAIRNLILIGYRGTGKTTVGRLLAEKLDWAFVDADDEVQRRAGKTIAQIFADQGESAFRDVEEQVVMDLVQRSEHIVSLGGGAILRENNRRAICAAGSAIWLTASPETIHARLQSDSATAERRSSTVVTASRASSRLGCHPPYASMSIRLEVGWVATLTLRCESRSPRKRR